MCSPASPPAGDGKRDSYLQRMLTRLNTEQPPVVKSGKAGERLLNFVYFIASRGSSAIDCRLHLCVI
jgi:hypothetical protein